MKLLFGLSIFLAMPGFIFPTKEQVRPMYKKAANSEAACKDLIKILAPFNENNNALLSGYKGSATMMMAKYVFNPFSKMSYFNKGKNILENAINTEKNNVELRFIRYCVQTNIPFFLGYKSDIKPDKEFILASLKKLDEIPLRTMIVEYFGEQEDLSSLEKQLLP
ncbi:MAG: hypothetical protein ABIP35_10705 [Ginsengibacter sp.]